MNTKTTNNTAVEGKGEAVNADLLVIPPPNTFLNIDCMALMKEMPDKYIDLAIVDPPYGINYDLIQEQSAGTYRTQNGGTWKQYHKTNWDDSPPALEYYKELFRVSKNQVIWGGNFFLDNLKNTKCMLIWDKVQRDNRADCEIAWTSFDKPSKIFRMSRADAYINKCDEKIHPTQKPTELYKWVLNYLGRAGDLILDTHVGSGSSLKACKELGYNYYGSEIDKTYYEAANKRINRAFRQFDLNLQ